MLRKIAILLFVGFSVGAPATASAEELVAKFTGDRSMQTRDFEIEEGPWLIDWIVNSDYPQAMGVGVALVNAKNGAHLGKVVASKVPGNGVRLLNDGGVFYFKIDSTVAYWTIKVIKLTPEEAELYTPKTTDGIR
ncbi:MAG: hypothetical protein PVJ33_08835 [Lysobacterales bacterium]